MDKVIERRYLAGTRVGKPLYIAFEPKQMTGDMKIVNRYFLTDVVEDAAKCLNKEAAKALIETYVSSSGSVKNFAIKPIHVEFWFEGDEIPYDPAEVTK